MRYVLLINIDKTAPRQRAEMEAILHGHERFQAELQAAGKMIHTERLWLGWRGQSRQAQSRTAVRDRRALRGDEGAPRWVLGDWVRPEGQSYRVGQEDPAPRRPRRRSSGGLAMRNGPEARLALVDAILTRGDLADYHLAPRRGPTCVGWWGNRPMPGLAAHGPSP